MDPARFTASAACAGCRAVRTPPFAVGITEPVPQGPQVLNHGVAAPPPPNPQDRFERVFRVLARREVQRL